MSGTETGVHQFNDQITTHTSKAKNPKGSQSVTQENIETCQLCSKEGHIARTCRLKISKYQVNLTCQLCNEVGHTVGFCPSLQRRERGSELSQCCNKRGHFIKGYCDFVPNLYYHQTGHYPGAHSRNSGFPGISNQIIKCFTCHGWGHWSRICPTRNNPINPNHRTVPETSQTGDSTKNRIQVPPISPPSATYAHIASKFPPLAICRYCKKEGHILPDCPVRFARYGPIPLRQGNMIGSPETGDATAPKIYPTFTLTGVKNEFKAMK